MKKNYYELLGIDRTATQDEIKQAFRTMIKKYHPDVNPAPNADEVAAQIIEAYDVLSNPKERMKYDSKVFNRTNTSSYQQPYQSQRTWQQHTKEAKKTQQQNEWQRQREERERKEAKSAYNYYHYGKTREESEVDFEDWIKDYIRKHREDKYYNLQKIEDYYKNDILEINNKIIYENIISEKSLSFDRSTPNDYGINAELDKLLADLRRKGIDISSLSFSKLKAIPPGIVPVEPIILKQVENSSNDSSLENNLKVIEFKKIYQDLVKELIYDSEYVKRLDSMTNYLSGSFQEKLKENIRRTVQDKRGVCTTFAMRLHFELNQLGIENYLMRVLKPTTIHWVNLYFVNNGIFVADITDDIVQDHYEYPLEYYRRRTPISSMISLAEFLKTTTPLCCSIVDPENDSFDNDTKIQEFLSNRLNQNSEHKKR